MCLRPKIKGTVTVAFCNLRAKFHHPSVNGGSIHFDTAFGQYVAHIPVRKRIAAVPAYSQQDDLRWKAALSANACIHLPVNGCLKGKRRDIGNLGNRKLRISTNQKLNATVPLKWLCRFIFSLPFRERHEVHSKLFDLWYYKFTDCPGGAQIFVC